jgi:cytochrome bd-type quinol oxidase subunit 2
MIQRIQSVWLLLAALLMGLMFRMPIYKGVLATGEEKKLLVGQNYLLFIVAGVLVVFPLVTLSLFKNRKSQKSLILLSILINLVFIGLIWMEVSDFTTSHTFTSSVYQIASVIPIICVVLLFLAFGAIRKDEKMIREAERLR